VVMIGSGYVVLLRTAAGVRPLNIVRIRTYSSRYVRAASEYVTVPACKSSTEWAWGGGEKESLDDLWCARIHNTDFHP